MMTEMAPEPVLVDCPRCGGEGSIAVERLYGRTAPEPYLWKPCGACSGLGSVPAEWVLECDDCKRAFWRGEGCDHHGATVCPDCALPNCHDCADERRDR